jgi:inhibitor of cysteine peptidase
MKRFDKTTQVIQVGLGQTFAIALAGNPTTGYTWQAEVDGQYLQRLGQEFEPHGQGVGAGGLEVLRFRALQTGETEITCGYKRPWETETRDTKHFSVRIV